MVGSFMALVLHGLRYLIGEIFSVASESTLEVVSRPIRRRRCEGSTGFESIRSVFV